MDDYIKMKDFLKYVKEGDLIDYDGFGCLCSSKNIKTNPEILINPSDVNNKFDRNYLKNFSGVVWYNR